MSDDPESANDFVDYFFQKEGDTFIAQLVRLREEYTAKCSQALSGANQSHRSDYNDFTARLLAPEKILPQICVVENFDFDKALAAVFENLDLDVTDTLEMITQYYGFISNLQNHWKGLELEPSTVVETSIQLMATLESMVYPLFLKLTNYIGCIASDPGKVCGPNTPEVMMNRFHKLSESLTMEIATIGASGVATLGQCPSSTRETMLDDSTKLGIQSRSAKNCISWALQAVAPSLQYYYLKAQTCESGTNPCVTETQTAHEDAMAEASAADVGVGAMEPSTDNVDLVDQSVSNMTMDGEEEEDEESILGTKDAQNQAKDDEFVVTGSMKIQTDEDETGTEGTGSEKEGSALSEQESNVSVTESERKVPGDAEDFQAETRDNAGPQIENDFVSYFFKKNGIKYVAILAQTKKKYEERCRTLLSANPGWKRTALSFMETVHDVRKISPVTGDVPDVADIDFAALLTTAVKDFDIDVSDKLTLIKSYQEYTKGMIRHWKYRIDNDKPLNADNVVDIGIQMMATTMALVYPIFIRVAEALRKLSKSEPVNQDFSPEGLAARLHILVEINARQMTAIGTSCLTVISSMPKISSAELEEKRNILESQMTLARNSVSWAMKAISPLLLLYFLHIIKTAGVQNSETSLSGRSEGGGGGSSRPRTGRDESQQSLRSTASEQSQQSDQSASTQSARSRGGGDDDDKLRKARKFYKAPSASKNLVFYFYAKQGQHYSSILTGLRTQYEVLVHAAMDHAAQSVKDKIEDFVDRYHEARKATVPKEDVDLMDIMFKEAVTKIFAGIEIDIQDNLTTLVKYFEFSKKLETHWNYRIDKGLELDQDAVLEMSVEMMGSTVALTYPVFIKIAEYTVSILKNHELSSSRLTPYDLVAKFRKFVVLLTTELAAIGMTCTAIMARLPNANRTEVAARATKLANETKTADGAISWAMKAIFPIFMLYFLQYSENAVAA